MHRCAVALAAVLLLGDAASALAGHTLAHYPSYYPDEIVAETLDPAAAAGRLADETLHAYIGSRPVFAGATPAHVRPIASLKSFLVLDFDPASPAFAAPERRCAAAAAIVAALAGRGGAEFAFHPYAVTPYHSDYVHHADRAQAATAMARAAAKQASGAKIGADGDLARAVAGAMLVGPGADAGVALREVPADGLLGAAGAVGIQLDGWLGPPWAKQGWFQAYNLLAASLEPMQRKVADQFYRRIVHGEAAGLEEEAELERHLVATLGGGCRRVVVGYALRLEYVNEAPSAGIENVAYDSHAGLNAPVFVRTAKLKDFPWNGSLRLGLSGRPYAAWNPVAGFTDAAGRLVWSALGDPALFPSPYNAGWAPTRAQFSVAAVRGQSGGIRLPSDALMPEPGTGALRPVAGRGFASAKATYEVVGSPYLDGAEMDMADAIYPFVFAYRWGAGAAPDGRPREPALGAALGTMRDRLLGLRPVRMKRDVQGIAENLDIEHRTAIIEAFLRDAPGVDNQVAALAPPWSAVPWHMLALMEAAVERGYAAFSRDEAVRRGVPWLDLARDPALHEKLLALCAEFARDRFRPPGLESFVTVEEAAARWRMLRAFALKHGHFLATNGPYRLKSWDGNSVVLTAVREASYPLGFGTFDHMADPPRAVIRQVTREPGAIMVRADAELAVKVLRSREIRREQLTRATALGTRGVQVASRYLLIGPDGRVAAAGRMDWQPDHRFKIALPEKLPRGRHVAVFGVFLDGNALLPAVGAFDFDAGVGN
ncbi:MAG: hypothetical protein ACT4N4_01895 [Rhodospirillales bacterium]